MHIVSYQPLRYISIFLLKFWKDLDNLSELILLLVGFWNKKVKFPIV